MPLAAHRTGWGTVFIFYGGRWATTDVGTVDVCMGLSLK